MSFLDNLENDLKALESREERDPEKIKRDRARQEEERNAALSKAPHIEALKTSAFTTDLLTECRMVGRAQRVLVQFVWIGDNLRLDAKTKRMELVPTESGIEAVMSEEGVEKGRVKVDPAKDNPKTLAKSWLGAA